MKYLSTYFQTDYTHSYIALYSSCCSLSLLFSLPFSHFAISLTFPRHSHPPLFFFLLFFQYCLTLCSLLLSFPRLPPTACYFLLLLHCSTYSFHHLRLHSPLHTCPYLLILLFYATYPLTQLRRRTLKTRWSVLWISLGSHRTASNYIIEPLIRAGYIRGRYGLHQGTIRDAFQVAPCINSVDVARSILCAGIVVARHALKGNTVTAALGHRPLPA